MYTVLRLTGEQLTTTAAADAINRVTPGTMSTRKGPSGGYGASVCDSDSWDDHIRALEAFIDNHRDSLSAATASGASAQFDAAIEPEDARGRLYTSFACPPSLHRDLGAVGASLVLSWYEGPQA
jgi:hypothetical protein